MAPLAPVATAETPIHNVPHALRGGRAGGAPWDVLGGTMSFIFVMDGLCAALNAAALAMG